MQADHLPFKSLKSPHGLKIQQRIEYKILSITYKTLQSGQPSYLHSLLNVRSNRTTRSSDIITLKRPSVRSRFKVTDKSLPIMLLYFGIIDPNNCGRPRRLNHSALQLILYYTSPVLASVSL